MNNTSILIKNVLLNEQHVNILIEGKMISRITPAETPIEEAGRTVIDGSTMAALPSFANCHTHSAMSLFRGYANDLPLERWLQEKIWPNEANLTPEIVYWGSKLACLEMIKSGTTCCNDMYFNIDETAKACNEMGMRAVISYCFFSKDFESDKQGILDFERQIPSMTQSELIDWCVAPHAVYTVSAESLKYTKDFTREHKMKYHIHAAESKTECTNAQNDFGLTPVRYLDKLNVLDEDTIIAHGLWLDDAEVDMLGAHKCTVVHNPNSNLKLSSGNTFRYSELKNAGAIVALGTDGCASSNNLDMVEAMKVMSLLQKGWRLDPTVLPAQEALQVATRNGFQALGINAGEIATGRLADLILVDLNNLAFVPNNNTVSNLVYAAHGDCVDTVICNGQIIMQHRVVPGEQEIIENARRVVKQLITV